MNAKGVHHFHGAVFTGTIRHPEYAPDGETIRLDIPRGLYNGAQDTFSWRWSHDYWGGESKTEATLGQIRLEAARLRGSASLRGRVLDGNLVILLGGDQVQG